MVHNEWLKFTVVELFVIMYATKKSLLFSGTFYHVLLEPSTMCNITKLREEMLNNIFNKLNSYWVEIFVEFHFVTSLIYTYSVLSYENIKQTYHGCLLYCMVQEANLNYVGLPFMYIFIKWSSTTTHASVYLSVVENMWRCPTLNNTFIHPYAL